MTGQMNSREFLINVGESEYKPLLDRERTIRDLKQLRPWLNLIEDVVNYGTNLIPRSFSSSDKKFKDIVIIGILLRQVVAMLDSVEILLSEGAVHAANLQMRALFEAYVYLEWILAGDPERKASYYYVHNLRRKRLWASRAQPGSPEWNDFVAIMGSMRVQPSDQAKQEANDQIKEIDRVLSGTKFSAINQDFEKHRRGKRDCSWHVPLGQKSLASLAQAIGKSSLYLILYSQGSEVMHTSVYDHHIKLEGDRVTFEPIRYLKGFEHVFRFSVSVALLAYMKILQEYRSEELPRFGHKYVEKWQKQYMNFLEIKYQIESTQI